MNATKTTRVPGMLYLLMGLPAVFNLQMIPARFVVPGDAAATAQRIATGTAIYRAGILCGVVSCVGFVLLALSLYELFKDVDRKQARLLLVLVSVSATIGLVNELNRFAPLILLSGADFLSAFTKPQLDALALGFLRLHSAGLAINSTFWGLWLLPFGILVMRSGRFPKILGICLLIGGFAYLVDSVTAIQLPAYRRVVSLAMLPFFAIGELPICLWLIIKGAPVAPSEAGAAA